MISGGNFYNDDTKFIIGEEIGGSQTMPSATLQHFYERTGKYPALFVADLACYGLQLVQIERSKPSQALCELVDYASKAVL